MIVVHWNALPPMTFAYTPITNHSSVKGHMAVMKLLCCVLLMPTYIKCSGILMLTNTGFLTLWFWKCFPKITSQSIWFCVIQNVQCSDVAVLCFLTLKL